MGECSGCSEWGRREQDREERKKSARCHGVVANYTQQVAEEQVLELRRELQDVESVLHSNQEEMSSLNEQLTEVCV